VPDVVDLIKAQHRLIEDLLERAQKGDGDVAELLRRVDGLLRPHSEAEESFVYPAIRDYDESEGEEVKDGTAEHHHIEAMLTELLQEDPDGPGFDGKLAAMAAELKHHVEEEESDLLPVLSEKASADERDELGTRFAEATGTEDLEIPASASTGEPTKEELYERAKEQGVEGRSTMTKDELARAVED